jgi:hypothetical protein
MIVNAEKHNVPNRCRVLRVRIHYGRDGDKSSREKHYMTQSLNIANEANVQG